MHKKVVPTHKGFERRGRDFFGRKENKRVCLNIDAGKVRMRLAAQYDAGVLHIAATCR